MNNNLLFRLIENLGRIRDGTLLLAGVVYTLGYIVWGIITWKNNLGSLIVLYGQYFVAGLPMLPAIIITYLIIHTLQKFVFKWWPNFFERFNYKVQFILNLIISIINSLFIIVLLFILDIMLFLIRSPLLYSSTFFERRLEKGTYIKDNKALKTIEKPAYHSFRQKFIFTYFYPFTILSIGIYLFVTTFYLKIPQDFVGAKPRYAVFDIDKNKFSETTINQIVDLKEQINSNNILHTKKITRSYFRQ